VKGQKLVHRHRFEIIRFHFLNPDDLSLSKAASAQGPILGDSGPLQWSKKAKNECPNPHGRSTIVQRLPFRPPEVALGSGYSTGKNPRSMRLILFDGRLNRRQNPSHGPRQTCPNCGADLILALPSGGKGLRTFQCFDCDRPDPMKTDEATGWLSGELGRTELGKTE
jgi:hypothetical protein